MLDLREELQMANLGIPANTISILQKYNFNFQKRFGQNFLIDTTVLDRIIAAAEITKDDCVLEIGPGIGTMTQYLCENAGEVVAVEIDNALIPILQETLKDYSNVSVINEDILKVDINRIVEEKNGGKPIKVVANLPYYITTPIIMGLFESHVPLKSITIMVQKEVADRMQEGPGSKDYGALSLAEDYLALDSLNIDILRIKGLAYYLKENWMLSADAFELAVELGDDTYAPHYYLAKDYSGLHMFREADEHFMRAWQLDSTRASLALEIAVNRTNGIAAYRTGVVPWFEKALKMMEPDSTLMSSIYQNYATAEYTRMDWDKAISLYQKAYEYNQKNISALSTIGYCYEQKKDYRHAVEYYERYLKVGRPGTRAYQFVEESLRFVRAERFMEDP